MRVDEEVKTFGEIRKSYGVRNVGYKERRETQVRCYGNEVSMVFPG